MSITETAVEDAQLDILLVSHLFPPETGGVQRLAESLAIHSSHSITVLASPTADYEWDDQYDFDVECRQLTGAVGLLTQFFFLLIHAREFDMIYFMRPEYGFLAWPARLLGVDVAAHAHGSELYANGSQQHELYLWASLRVITDFVAISDWTSDRLQDLDVPERDISVVHNGVDYEHFQNGDPSSVAWTPDSDRPVLLTVSRLADRKGQDLVIEALPKLEQEVDYLVAGPGDSKELERLAEKHGVADQIHFLGKVPDDDLPSYYALADIFVMPTRFIEGDIEGFGLVYLEANAAGTPVIGASTGGVPSAIDHEKSGLLCEPSVGAVADAITRLLSDDDLRSRLEDGADEWARKHDWQMVTETWDDTLRSIARQA